MAHRMSPPPAWRCVLLSGPAGSGKTTLCRLGYRAMVATWGHYGRHHRHRSVNGTLIAPARDTKRGLAGVAHVDFYLQLGGEICLILPPSERTCRRLSQDVASRETSRNRKVINTKSAHDNQNREPHKDRQRRP
jgi:energy-coupling factor transporter ATP-binding protein EcfA2